MTSSQTCICILQDKEIDDVIEMTSEHQNLVVALVVIENFQRWSPPETNEYDVGRKIQSIVDDGIYYFRCISSNNNVIADIYHCANGKQNVEVLNVTCCGTMVCNNPHCDSRTRFNDVHQVRNRKKGSGKCTSCHQDLEQFNCPVKKTVAYQNVDSESDIQVVYKVTLSR